MGWTRFSRRSLPSLAAILVIALALLATGVALLNHRAGPGAALTPAASTVEHLVVQGQAAEQILRVPR
jgi:hypothetical protein